MSENAIRSNVARIGEEIARAAKRAGRRAEQITLVAVSKTVSAPVIREAFEAGLRHFGENRVQELAGKRDALSDLAVMWHLVGHLQSNKAARAAAIFHAVDSVDDFALAQRLEGACAEQCAGGAGKLRVLIEVRVAEEESKSGVAESELGALAEQMVTLPHLDLAGLMCVPPYFEDSARVRPYFQRMRGLREGLEKRLGRRLPVLSMGMSHDFEVAIEEGATEVRIGTALFGTRPKL